MTTHGLELARLRSEIERVDHAIVTLIAERVQLACEIGEAKRAEGMPTVDPAREASIIRRAADLAREAGIPDEEVRDIFWRLIGLSRRSQLEALSGAA